MIRALVVLALCTLPGLSVAQSPPPAEPIGAPATAAAIDAGIGWLLRHQEEAGGWSASQFQRHDPKGDLCTGTGKPDQDLHVTAWATLALLARGNTERTGPHRQPVQKALAWLDTQKQDDGFFGAPEAGNAVVAHALSCLAMSEGKGLSDQAMPKKSLARLAALRLPDGTWPVRLGETKGDPMTTYWASMGCGSRAAFGGVKMDLETTLMTMAKGGLAAPTPPSIEAMLRWIAQHHPKDDARLVALTATLGAQLPQWRDGQEAARMDFLDWHVGTFAMFQAGGAAWQRWHAALQAALVDHQRTDGAHVGSWDPVDANGKQGGRIYATAVNVLSLAVGHRFGRIVDRGGAAKKK
ncbi:MAG: hypothetical protein Q7T30_03690 [Planctomycetota bacterium]|nr:hypothetical protein [Planctomycetota bacterium]